MPGESGEMYLETILILSQKKEFVRSVDVCEYMSYSKPSVSRAMGLLRESGYIEIDERNHITLTQKGLELASKIFERHNIISRVLVSLGVDEKTAADDACKIEHVISDEAFEAIKRHIQAMSGSSKSQNQP